MNHPEGHGVFGGRQNDDPVAPLFSPFLQGSQNCMKRNALPVNRAVPAGQGRHLSAFIWRLGCEPLGHSLHGAVPSPMVPYKQFRQRRPSKPCPRAQRLQALPSELATSGKGHGLHSKAFGLSLNEKKQRLQIDFLSKRFPLSAVINCRGLQETQTVVPGAEDVPLGQGMHAFGDVLPVDLLKVPDGQGVQMSIPCAPSKVLNVPAGHGLQEEAEEKVPGLQLLGAAVVQEISNKSEEESSR